MKNIMQVSPFGQEQDKIYMVQALECAGQAFAQDEVPIGAIIVDPQGVVVARAYNQVEGQHTQRAHAEMLAVEEAGKKLGDWRLDGYWLYVTLEPCSMCMHFMMLSRLGGIVYGADSPLFGYRLDNSASLRVYKRDIVEIVGGVCAQESADLLKQFFRKRRIDGG